MYQYSSHLFILFRGQVITTVLYFIYSLFVCNLL
nr:MAG TPA: hypothetical protein [Caudoviricetes sp.]